MATTPKDRSYLIIAPCRDEAKYLQRTMDSLVAQTLRPKLLLVVDDGSTDETPKLLAEYAEKHDFVRIIRKEDRGGRSVGPGVIETFYYGWDRINPAEYEYVCKLDLDLDLPPRYFETLVERMEADPRLGTCSGKPYFPARALAAPDGEPPAFGPRPTNGGPVPDYRSAYGELISEECGDEMSVGMTKFYRRACFEDIGGFVREVMWDGIDCHTCRMKGWVAASWDDPELRFIHLRPMGSSHKGILTGRMRHGFGQYFMGTSLPYITASALFRMTRPPYLVGGLGILLGYVESMVKGKKRYDNPEFQRFVRQYQIDCLLKGKPRATQELNARQATVWQQRYPTP